MEIKNYDKEYQKDFLNYQELLKEYNKLINTSEYKNAIYTAPFEFLRVLYLSKRIDLYIHSDNNEKPVFVFTSAQEVLSTYRDLINFNKDTNDLLDKATLIASADELANKINDTVNKSIYLNDNLIISKDEKISSIAKEYLQEIPKISKVIDNHLRINILTDVLNKFDEKQIVQLAMKNVFKPSDIEEFIQKGVNEKGKHNIEVLCKGFHYDLTPIKITNLRLKGTSFKTDSGISRQDNIKLLKEYIENKGIPSLSVQFLTYKNDLGVEEPSVKVLWGDKELGFLPKETSAILHEQYSNKIISVKVKECLGGGTCNYGLEVTLGIYEKMNEKNNLKNQEKEDMEK